MEEFILPEKWCCQSKNNYESGILNDFINSKGYNATLSKNNFYIHYPFIHGGSAWDYNKPGYTQINFEQFEKYVLNKPDVNMKPKEDLKLNQIIIKLLS